MEHHQPEEASASKDFYLSYTSRDIIWAEWIAAQLEQTGHTCILASWDFRPGQNLIQEIDRALKTARRVLLVLSEAYLKDALAQAEWAAVWQRSLREGENRLLPVRIESCKVEGLLGPIITVDLFAGKSDEEQTRAILLAGLPTGRQQPGEIHFPGIGVPFAGHLPVIWHVPYYRNSCFTGREEEMAALRTRLHDQHNATIGQVQAISGLGGVGKTQLAVEYAWRHQAMYQAVLWVRADTIESLHASYSELASILQTPGWDEQQQDLVVRGVKEWLRTHQDYLLILDNADTPGLLPPFVPTDARGHLLITTRSATIGEAGLGLALPLAMETLTPDLGTQLLLRRSGRVATATLEECAIARQLSAELGNLPLALDQAGAYIASKNISLPRYLELYQQYRLRVLKERHNQLDHPEPVVTTWNISLQAVTQQNSAAADLLAFCAFLAPDAIPEEIFTEHVAVFDLTFVEPLIFEDAIETLRSYSLIERNPQTHALLVHRLVQAVQREMLSQNDQEKWALQAGEVVSKMFPASSHSPVAIISSNPEYVKIAQKVFDDSDLAIVSRVYPDKPQRNRNLVLDLLLPHTMVCVAYLEQLQSGMSKAGLRKCHKLVHTLYKRAYVYLNQCGRYIEAEEFWQKAQETSAPEPEARPINEAKDILSQAALYQNQGKYSKAEPLARRALAIIEKELGPSHHQTAGCLNELAIICHKQKKFEEAEAYYQRGLEICEKNLGSSHPDTATILNCLGMLCLDLGRYAEVGPLLVRSLEIRQKTLGWMHPATLTSLNNMGLFSFKMGDIARAEAFWQHALIRRIQILSPGHPDIATSQFNLGNLYIHQKKYIEAEPFVRGALEIWQKTLGAGHSRTHMARTTYAELQEKMKTSRPGQKRHKM